VIRVADVRYIHTIVIVVTGIQVVKVVTVIAVVVNVTLVYVWFYSRYCYRLTVQLLTPMVLIVLYVISETSSFFTKGPKVPADVGPSQRARQVLETSGSAPRLQSKIQLRSHRLCQFSEEGILWK
jgi:hypothetical protein